MIEELGELEGESDLKVGDWVIMGKPQLGNVISDINI
jgi:hypothetical protein